jgi:arylsulfatase A-like enzyme
VAELDAGLRSWAGVLARATGRDVASTPGAGAAGGAGAALLASCDATLSPAAALIADLRARGLLDSTLVVWAGEFGRTPFSQGADGRDHNPYGFSVWLAGGGVKAGTIHGATDEFGYHAVENIHTVYDLWATVLHLLGVDHEELTYRYSGRDYRLTDVHGHPIREIIA